ncbi:hypothetical protein C2E23DRAFT_745134 [Lenzites betulinus]|nr:hypothetical protein C2E23DRAFT_745134 [Lenzites betulinus]
MVSQDLLRDLDAVARSLGRTPKLDKNGAVVPIGRMEGGEVIYVVWIGRGVGLFYNWGLTHAMTCGFPGCAFKSYKGIDNARRGWLQGPTRREGAWFPPAPRVAISTPGLPPPSPPSPTLRDDLEIPPEIRFCKPLIHDVTVDYPDAPPQLYEEFWDSDGEAGRIYEAEPPSSPSPPPSPLRIPWRDYIQAQGKSTASMSPTISSVSSFPLSSLLSDGTVSPYTIHTPLLTSPTFKPDGLGATTASPTGRQLQESPTSASAAAKHAAHAPAQPRNQQTSAPAPTHLRIVYVVVRGDYPGVYLSKDVTLEKLGVNPGMKIVRFDSLSRASWYFAQEFMANRVGTPILTDEGKHKS